LSLFPNIWAKIEVIESLGFFFWAFRLGGFAVGYLVTFLLYSEAQY
jgi:hypothetical protein